MLPFLVLPCERPREMDYWPAEKAFSEVVEEAVVAAAEEEVSIGMPAQYLSDFE